MERTETASRSMLLIQDLIMTLVLQRNAHRDRVADNVEHRRRLLDIFAKCHDLLPRRIAFDPIRQADIFVAGSNLIRESQERVQIKVAFQFKLEAIDLAPLSSS